MVEVNKEDKMKEKEKKEVEVKKEERNTTQKKDLVKKKKVEAKEVAVANGFSLRISPKNTYAACKVITKKTPEQAIMRLEEVLRGRRPIPMASREVAHQKGKGIAGAKFPKNVCEEMIKLINQVKANANISGIENPVITLAMANQASAPFRRGGRKAKRTHLHIEVRDKTKIRRDK